MVTLSELNAFRPASAWADNTKLNLDGQGGVGNAGNYGGILSARNREQTERDANNAVRTELLKALARTFDIKMTDRPVNGTHFSQHFMERLELLLGPAFRRDDFKVGEDGVVSSGRPLTARRIKAILQSAQDAASNTQYNDNIKSKLRDDAVNLPDGSGFASMVVNTYDAVKDRFGALGVPAEYEMEELVHGSKLNQIFKRFEFSGKRVTPEAIRDEYRKYAIEQGALRLAINKTQQIIGAQGVQDDANIVFHHIDRRHPEILRAILKARTPAAAEAAFNKFAQVVEADYERYKICNREVREFNFKFQNAIAQRLGIPVANLVGMLNQLGIKNLALDLMNDILDGKNPADGADAIKAAFENYAARLADERANAFARIDGMGISVSAKDRLKKIVLSYESLRKLNFDRIFQAGANQQAGLLKERLDANALKEDIYNAMRSFTSELDEPINAMFDADRAAGKDIGVEELYSVSKLVHEVFFGRNPGLRDQVAAFLKRPDVLEDNIHDPQQPAFAACHFEHIVRDEEGNNIPSAKEHVLANLGTPQLNPIYAQSLVSAARELGRNDPPDAVIALFAAGTPAGDLLREALGQFEGELDTTTLKAFAIGVLQHQ